MEKHVDLLEDMDVKNKIPSMLNVLTILTFIGSALGVLFSFLLPLSCKVLDMDNMADKMKPKDIEMLRLTCENINAILIVSIIGSIICALGAYQMRKLKSSGFIVYVAGQIIPVITMFFLIGSSMFAEPKNLFSYIIILVFIILYATQRKHLTQ